MERQSSTMGKTITSQQLLEIQKKETEAARKRLQEKMTEDAIDRLNRKTMEVDALHKEQEKNKAAGIDAAGLLELIEAMKKEREAMAKQIEELKTVKASVSASVSAAPGVGSVAAPPAAAAAAAAAAPAAAPAAATTPSTPTSPTAADKTPKGAVVVDDDRIDPLSIKEGWLNKEGVTRRAMKRRYFILNLTRLQYYDDKSVSSPMLGFVALYKDTIVQKESGKKGAYIFAVTPSPGQRTFFIQAHDDVERSNWMTAIKELLPSLPLSTNDKERMGRLKKKRLIIGKKTQGATSVAAEEKDDGTKVDPLSSKEGWLLKEGEWNHAFKKRYFVLSLNRLQYFKDKVHGEKPQGFISLYQDTLVVPGNPEKGAHMLLLTPAPGERTFHIQAKDDATRDEWITAIRALLKNLLPSVKAKHPHIVKKAPTLKPGGVAANTDKDHSGAASPTTPSSPTHAAVTTAASGGGGGGGGAHDSGDGVSESMSSGAAFGDAHPDDLTIEVLEDEDVYVRCVFDFETDVEGDLRFRKGDILRLLTPNVNFAELDPNNPIWLHGELMTTTVAGLDSPLIGTFPSNYVEEIRDKDD